MAYQNYGKGGSGNTSGSRGGFNGSPRPAFNQPAAPAVQTVTAKEIPADYAAAAEKVILQPTMVGNISTSKLRNFFGLFSDMYNDVKRSSSDRLTEEQVNALTGARIRMIYECGREPKVKTFVDAAQLIPYLLSVGNSAAKMMKFYHYFEALIAYHKYYGGKA